MTIQVHSITELKDALQKTDENTLVLLDVDDTLITPKANMFRCKNNNPHRVLIDELKKNKHRYPNFTEILSQWRTHRKSILVHAEWPFMIEQIKKRGTTVFALTKMETGPFGVIPSMEEWRYQELTDKKIIFSKSNFDEDKKILKQNKKGYGVFYKGILMTGPFNKAEVLEVFLETIHPNKIILVDDREEHVLSIEKLARRLEIEFMGIVLKTAEDIPGTPRAEIIEIQKKYLLEQAKWLEDEVAEEKLKI